MIDTSENLIIIKGQIKTPEIESCQNYDGSYKIVFRNVPSTYTYKEENVLWLTDPDKPAPNNYQIISKGRTLSNNKKYPYKPLFSKINTYLCPLKHRKKK